MTESFLYVKKESEKATNQDTGIWMKFQKINETLTGKERQGYTVPRGVVPLEKLIGDVRLG